MIVGGVLALKAIDYGWTAWDAYQATRTLADPQASAADKAAAASNLALTAACEAAEPDDLLPVALPLDDLVRVGVLGGTRRFTTRASGDAAQAFVQQVAQAAEERVVREGWRGDFAQALQQASTQQPELLSGLFKYGGKPIENYQQHHLWPIALGGPKEGWIVYAKNPHTEAGGIQDRLNQFMRSRLNMKQRELEEWARRNPANALPLLREFYQSEGINFPY